MRGKIRSQPLFFWRSGPTAANFPALRIQHHNVPRAEFVAVVTCFRVSRGRAEILEVVVCTRGMKLVVAHRRMGSALHASPGFVVALEIFRRAIWISQVSKG